MTCEIDKYARVDYAEQKKAQLRRVNWNQNITRQINARGADWQLLHKGDL
jgi:hypothetical protein